MSFQNLQINPKQLESLLKEALDPVQAASNPNFPYTGQRASLQQLQDQGLTAEDFFGGGGKIMFSDPVQSSGTVQGTLPAAAMGKSPQAPSALPAQALKTKPAAMPAAKKQMKAPTIQPGTVKAGEALDYLLKKAVKTPAQAPLSPYDQFVRDNVGQKNWEARNAAGVPGLTQQEQQSSMDQFYPQGKVERERQQAAAAQRQLMQEEAARRSPEGRMKTMARNREVDTIAAQARQMTEANNAAKAQGQPLPYTGENYAPTYPGGKLPDSAKSPSAVAAAAKKPAGNAPAFINTPEDTDRLLEGDMKNPFSSRPTSLFTPSAPTTPGYTPAQGSSTFSPQGFSLAPAQIASPGFQFNGNSAPESTHPNPVNINPPVTKVTAPAGVPRAASVKPPKMGRPAGAILGSNQNVGSFQKYSSEKLAHADIEMAWQGFVRELKKQGANEDFLLGMMKEAEEKAAFDGSHILEKLKGVLKGSQMPDSTGEAANRHPIIPGLSNKWLGLAGGAGLGALLGGELGVDGPIGALLPIAGGFAGHHYLPQLMNRWKDAYGSGVNKVHPGIAALNRSNPLTIPGAQR